MRLADATLEVVEGHELDGRLGRTPRSNQCRGEHDDGEAVHETLPSVTGVQAYDRTNRARTGQPRLLWSGR